MPAVTSAAGLLALLDERNDELKRYALNNLDKVVHEYWFQISGSIASVEALYEDDEFKDRELAALVASKVFYHLGELDDALTYALGAGSSFDVNEQSEYVQTLVARCLDKYFELRVQQVEQHEEVDIDSRLVAIVERMLDRCCEQGQVEQAVGLALEARRLDKVEEVVGRAADGVVAIRYALRACQDLVINRDFRQQDDQLLAVQVCFDLVENEMQPFLTKQRKQGQLQQQPWTQMPQRLRQLMLLQQPRLPAPPQTTDLSGSVLEEVEAGHASKLVKLRGILSGRTPVSLHLDFLHRHNHADLQILKNINSSVDPRNSVTHSATIMANALMHAGTTVDTFLRENLEWLKKATNWA
ncbi:26S proteasome non-ATPase regulatory subunit 1 homolog, partial [Haematococcus lacustris]